MIQYMARCYYYRYPWRDVIITFHGDMLLLSMPWWQDDIITIYGEILLLSMARCYYYYPWREY